MARQFQQVGGLNPGRSVFDLTHRRMLDCDMGQLIPILCEDLLPGDKFRISNEMLIRAQPMLAPIGTPIKAYIHYFAVPYRLLWTQWEDFITGGEDGTLNPTQPKMGWVALSKTPEGINLTSAAEGDLLDYLGFPVGKSFTASGATNPLIYPFKAYWEIMREYYRDENIDGDLWEEDDAVGEGGMNFELDGVVAVDGSKPFYRRWAKGYFESCLPWQQRGNALALPIYGSTFADFTAAFDPYNIAYDYDAISIRSDNNTIAVNNDTLESNAVAAFNKNNVDLSSATSVGISELRQSFQIQKWLERSARGGARYVEAIKAHFGVPIQDARMQRPEYIGGMQQPVIISEVLQTSSTDATTPQGNMAGHGISVGGGFAVDFTAPEHCIVMGIMSIMPEAMYQQGLDRRWTRETKYDYYWPEFAHLSEQSVLSKEVYYNADANDGLIFGYQGRYDEYRYRASTAHGSLRGDLKYWHLGRIFDSRPALNSEFLSTEGIRKDVFAVPSEPAFIVQVLNKVTAIRPMPMIADPGMIDHF